MSDKTEGKSLPTVTLQATEIGKVRIPDDLKGKWTLLYFYPEDDTPGCTKQACSYRDNIGTFKKLGVDVLGVSADDMQSHEAFKGKFELNFPLLADTDRVLSEALGVWGEQEWKGEKYMGLSRDTFLVGPDVKVRRAWRKVAPSTTMQETYAEAERLIKG